MSNAEVTVTLPIDKEVEYIYSIKDRMFNKDEVVIYAQRISVPEADDYDDVDYYKVKTIDNNGFIRTRYRDVNSVKWH